MLCIGFGLLPQDSSRMVPTTAPCNFVVQLDTARRLMWSMVTRQGILWIQHPFFLLEVLLWRSEGPDTCAMPSTMPQSTYAFGPPPLLPTSSSKALKASGTTWPCLMPRRSPSCTSMLWRSLVCLISLVRPSSLLRIHSSGASTGTCFAIPSCGSTFFCQIHLIHA